METTKANNHYDYESLWQSYAYPDGMQRFLSTDPSELEKFCEVIDVDSGRTQNVTGCIPVCYDRENRRLFVLKGPHTRVCGETGSKKSRTVVRGGLISTILSRNSFIVTDPKGELYADPKIRNLMREREIETHCLDFRHLDKDGFNILENIYQKYKAGDLSAASTAIGKLVEMLKDSKSGGDDPYWNGTAGSAISAVLQMNLAALKNYSAGKQMFNLSTIKSYIRQYREPLLRLTSDILENTPNGVAFSAVREYDEMLQLPDKTYSCVVSSANMLLQDFTSSPQLLEMLSVSTFDVQTLYQKPTGLFLIIPDEHKGYDQVTGYLIDLFYQILIEEFGNQYQNNSSLQPLRINFICDEVASLRINDLKSKISASRSRNIDWTLIYQSEKQMAATYRNDYGTICGNCKNYIFLGSSDTELLEEVSKMCGTAHFEKDEPLVSVNDLRQMRKESDYKDALIINGNQLICARLPDYEVYDFLQDADEAPAVNKAANKAAKKRPGILVYTPEQMLDDYRSRRFSFTSDEENFRRSVSEALGRR